MDCIHYHRYLRCLSSVHSSHRHKWLFMRYSSIQMSLSLFMQVSNVTEEWKSILCRTDGWNNASLTDPLHRLKPVVSQSWRWHGVIPVGLWEMVELFPFLLCLLLCPLPAVNKLLESCQLSGDAFCVKSLWKPTCWLTSSLPSPPLSLPLPPPSSPVSLSIPPFHPLLPPCHLLATSSQIVLYR